MPDSLLALLGKAVIYLLEVGAGTLAATWLAIKFLPEQWLKHRFDKQLEQQRNEHAQQLEEARHRLGLLQKRLSTLHEKEFDVLADAWQKLNEAHSHVAGLVSALQTYPNFDSMSEARFKSFVAECKLDQVDRDELLGKLPEERNEFYQERIVLYRIHDAKIACNALHRTIQRNSIFLEPRIRDLFRQIDNAAWRTLTSREIGQEAGDHKLWLEAGRKFTEEVVPLKDEIEREVQKRLGYE